MELLNFEKETSEPSALRLVADNKDPLLLPVIEKQFVNFMFFRVNPEWRKLNAETKKVFRAEFQNVFNKFEESLLLFSYSLIGFDSKADLMFWRIGTSLDAIQEMTAKLYRTNLGSFLETTDNHLSITKKMMFVSPETHKSIEDRFHVIAGEKKYHFLYPCAKQSEWYEKNGDERDELIKDNFMVGKKFPNIKIHLTHAFGFSDKEYIISFETDEPNDFLALAEELRQTPASKFTMRVMPVYTCRLRPLAECLEAIG